MPYKPTPLLLFSIFLVALCNSNLVAQTYTIPFAEKQPAWIFPLWFTNGDGQKDTIYLAYDPEASEFVIDTVFGEYGIEPNDSAFYIRTGPDWKVFATNYISYAIDLSGYNIVYPFTVTYDASLMYSDSLPGTPSDVVPKVWARLDGTGLIESCPNIDFDGFTVIFVDTVIEGYPSSAIDDPHCLRDSLVIVEGLISISLGLMEWDPPTSLPNQTNAIPEEINAWFEGNSLAISVNSSENSKLRLFNLSGVLLFERDLPAGNYLIREDLARILLDIHGVIIINTVNAQASQSKKLSIY